MFSHSMCIINFWKCNLQNLLHLSHCDGNIYFGKWCLGHKGERPPELCHYHPRIHVYIFSCQPPAFVKSVSTWQGDDSIKFRRGSFRELAFCSSPSWLHESPQPAVTKYHRLDGWNNRNLLFIVLEAGESKITVPADLGPPRGLSSGLQMAAFSWCPPWGGKSLRQREREIASKCFGVFSY